MPPDGYKDVLSASETDFNGVNSVIINCECFQTKVTDDLSKNGNIFDKARKIGRDVRHSSNLEVEDKDLKQYFIDLHNLLSDTGHLKTAKYAKSAREKLSELKDDKLLIGKDDVRKVLDDVAKVAHKKIKTRAEKIKNELIEATRKFLATLKSKEKVTLAEIDNVLKSAIGVIENRTKVSRKRINTETDRGVKKLKIETKSGVRVIHKATDECANKILKESENAMDQVKQTLEELKKANKQKKEEEYIAAKKNLQSDLVAFYRDSCSTVNICPGLDDVDASLTDVYIPPYPLYSKETDTLKNVAKQSTIKNETHIPNYFSDMVKDLQEETPDGKPVNSLQEMFYKQSKECMNIYLTAEPGLGKTSFVKWLSLNWCQAHEPVKEDDHYFDREEVNQLKKFDFVFIIFLRKINDKNMNVDSMIRNTILPALGRQNKYTIDMIERVMCEERCLIVLDGLDEWNVSSIPKRLIRPSCTYITTSRPWKFCSIALSSKEIDQMVCIENVQKICKERLISSIMALFEKRKHLRKDMSDTNKACKEFIKELEDKKVSHFYGTPVILAHLVYLWNMEKSIGNSQFEIYSDMVDALFSIVEDKIDLSKLKNTRSSQISYFQELLCETYYDLMIRLGKLAFNLLFSDNKLSSLVFDEKVTEKYLTVEDSNILADEILDTCLKTGLLTKQPVYVKSKRKKYTYSFQHKTVQEYFAALYIQAEYGTTIEAMIVKKCHMALTVLEMGTVFMFLSGVSPSISGRVFQSLPDDDCMQYFRNESSTVSFFAIWEIQDMKVNCAIECRNNGNEEFNLHLDDVIINESIKEEHSFPQDNVPLSQLRLNTHLQQLTLENVPLSQLQLNEHLQQLALENVPLSQLQLNEHLQKLTLKNVPLSQLQLIEHLQQLTLDSVPLSQLQLNKHLQQLALDSVPLLKLQLNEQLKRLRLCRVPYFILSKEQEFTVFLQTMMNEGSVSGEDVKSVNITGSLNSLEECSMDALPVTTVTAILNSLPVESKLKILSCEGCKFPDFDIFSTPTDYTALFSTIPKLCHLQNIELKYMNICDNILELPCVDGLQLHLTGVTLTNKILYKLLRTKQNVRIHFLDITVRDDTVEYELHTSEQDGSIKADSYSSIVNRIEFDFRLVEISSKSFLQFVKVVEKCNSKVNLKIENIYKDEIKQYREGIDYVKCLSSFIVTEDVKLKFVSVIIIKNV
ncbi:uncharacterized protein LOC132752446 [Ruditapes philippinarum]|uniref:uncharacterized protein LOC132752446 n=1 Tax=Ruditapes philippinarum TaxID=129788 RepID=UPI00295B0307|nr:uncharacterized protein LOC132752446 [Ruditapes philippinarum]